MKNQSFIQVNDQQVEYTLSDDLCTLEFTFQDSQGIDRAVEIDVSSLKVNGSNIEQIIREGVKALDLKIEKLIINDCCRKFMDGIKTVTEEKQDTEYEFIKYKRLYLSLLDACHFMRYFKAMQNIDRIHIKDIDAHRDSCVFHEFEIGEYDSDSED